MSKPQIKSFFKRRRGCPFTGDDAPAIDYKDVRTLTRYVSESGKMIPRRITNVSSKNQRKLSTAVKRARHIALLPFSTE